MVDRYGLPQRICHLFVVDRQSLRFLEVKIWVPVGAETDRSQGNSDIGVSNHFTRPLDVKSAWHGSHRLQLKVHSETDIDLESDSLTGSLLSPLRVKALPLVSRRGSASTPLTGLQSLVNCPCFLHVKHTCWPLGLGLCPRFFPRLKHVY
jgi:hypothetical protein